MLKFQAKNRKQNLNVKTIEETNNLSERDFLHPQVSILKMSGGDGASSKTPTLNSVITLNVGGTKFETTRQTLLNDPRSMLAKMFDPVSPLQPGNLLVNVINIVLLKRTTLIKFMTFNN